MTAWTGQMLIARVGDSRTRLLVFTMLVVALLTALISVNGAVAALLPVVVVTAVRLGRPTSQLLMPFVFAAHAGSLLALTGTPVNVLVSDAAVDAGLPAVRLFRVRPGRRSRCWSARSLIAVLFGQRLLPDRRGQTIPPDLSRHARTLVEQYRLDDGVFQLRVRPSSPYVGQPRADASTSAPTRASTLVAIQAADRRGPRRGRRRRRGRHPDRARRCRSGRRAGGRPAPRLPLGGWRRRGRRDAVQPRLRARRGRDPAALRAWSGKRCSRAW